MGKIRNRITELVKLEKDEYRIKNNLLIKGLFSLLILFSLLVTAGFVHLSKNRIISIIIVLIVIIVSWKKLLYGFYVFVFSLPFTFLPDIFGKNLAIAEILVFVLLAVFCLKNFKKPEIKLKRTMFQKLDTGSDCSQ